MGGRETAHSTQLQGLVARVHAVAVESPAVADVVVLQEALEQVDYDLDSSQQPPGVRAFKSIKNEGERWGNHEKSMNIEVKSR